jgi:hypothetical protein
VAHAEGQQQAFQAGCWGLDYPVTWALRLGCCLLLTLAAGRGDNKDLWCWAAIPVLLGVPTTGHLPLAPGRSHSGPGRQGREVGPEERWRGESDLPGVGAAKTDIHKEMSPEPGLLS